MSKLIGLGVGPGDPDYVTVKGVKAIKVADVIFVPVGNTGDPGYAEEIVRHYAPQDNIVRLPFELGNWADDYEERRLAWDEAAKPVIEALNEGKQCLFATIGDPNVYATFTYLARAVSRARPDTETNELTEKTTC
ncbi:SAM-dependent methyltransferase [Stomatohabitans albus]|uniref:SAM-dependent methyltransferase n=1 Tax=Stomatohabitans albus TaxID=3110766 RepID=UPI00300D34B0